MALLHKNNRSVDKRKDFVKQQKNDKDSQSEDSRLHNPVTVAPDTNPDGTINPQGVQSGPNQNEFKLSGQLPKTPNPRDEARRLDAEHLKVIERTRAADQKNANKDDDKNLSDSDKKRRDEQKSEEEKRQDNQDQRDEQKRRDDEKARQADDERRRNR